MAKQLILDSSEVAKLERLIEEATRSTEEGVRRFVEPASGTLDRAVSRQHHLVFGRRGSGKREELSRDTLDESQRLEEEFTRVASFVKDYSNANVFLMDKDLPDSEMAPIEELVDLRLIHRVKASVTVGDRPGKKFEAFMLDVSQYTASRKKRELEIIEFWRPDATDSIRRKGLIYKEFDGKNVITKNVPEQH